MSTALPAPAAPAAAPGPAACTLPEPRAIAPPTGPDPREIIPHLPRP